MALEIRRPKTACPFYFFPPFDDTRWQTEITAAHGLESSRRPRGRPKRTEKKNAAFVFSAFTASLHAQEIQRLPVRGPVVAEIVSIVGLTHKESGFAFGFKVIDPKLARSVIDGAFGKRQSPAIFRPSDVRIETFGIAADLQIRAAALR